MSTLADHWSALATSALLGADRRTAPPAPVGPLEDLAVDRADAEPAERLLDAVAMLSAMRRAGVLPGAPAAPLPLPVDDRRPECPARAVLRLYRLLDEWPHLLLEWVETVQRQGWRLPPDVAALLLGRRRTAADVRAAAVLAAGPLGTWLAQVLPDEFESGVARGSKQSADGKQSAGGKQGGAQAPEVPLPAAMVRRSDETPDEFAARVARALASATLKHIHRPALVRMVSALPLDHLRPFVAALSRAATHPETMGLVVSLSDLAQFRWDLHEELLP